RARGAGDRAGPAASARQSLSRPVARRPGLGLRAKRQRRAAAASVPAARSARGRSRPGPGRARAAGGAADTAGGRLSTHLRRRDTVVLGKYAQGFTVEQARRYHEATYSIGMGAARRFVRQVDLTRRRQILDLGGGSGCYCIVAAQHHPRLRATVLDLSPVVEVTREFIASHGLADRV